MLSLTRTETDEIRRELWHRGELSWKLRPEPSKQREAFSAIKASGAHKYVINSTRRFGKSFKLCLFALEFGIKNPGVQIRFAAPTQKALRRIILPLFRIILKDCPPELRPVWKTQDGLYKFPNGSELSVSGANNGHDEDLRGTAADLCIVDEAGFIKDLNYLVEDILMPQLLPTGGRLIMSSTPPRTPAHDFVEYAQAAESEGNYSKYTIYEAGYPPEIVEAFKKEAGGENSTTWKREYLAEFVIDEDFAIIPEWKEAYAATEQRDEFYPYYHSYTSMDLGVRDFTAVLFAYYDFLKAKLVIEDELTMSGPKMTTDLLARAVKQKELDLFPSKKIYQRVSDNNNLILLQDLSIAHDLHFLATSKDTLEAMVNKARVWVSSGKIVVNPRCTQLLGCLKYGIWDDNRKEFARSKTYGHFDALASLIYLIRNVDVFSNPIPKTYGMAEGTHYIEKDLSRNDSKSAAVIRGIFKPKKHG